MKRVINISLHTELFPFSPVVETKINITQLFDTKVYMKEESQQSGGRAQVLCNEDRNQASEYKENF